MDKKIKKTVEEVCTSCGNDRSRIMDIVTHLQRSNGCVSSEAIDLIAKIVKAPRVEVEGVVSFYAFLAEEQKGKFVIRVCNDVVDNMQGAGKVAEAFSEELGIGIGETTSDGMFTLEYAPCIGMCDQAPAALINDTPVTYLSSDKAREIVAELKKNQDIKKIVHRLGDGNNADELVHSMVHNGIRTKGEVIFSPFESGTAIKKALSISPVEVIKEIKTSRLRGRGGAGFPTGMKWEFTRAAQGDKKFILCNADEGEPGTFKDRVLLTEKYDMLFEGMTIAGYAIGASTGIIYLRGEYAYLYTFLNKKLDERREAGLLGNAVAGKKGFDFDIRIQLGAGAYVCGEETALISSCEGLRGDPKNRPPFPAQKGYLGYPTSVNNVETFCCVARIVEKGAASFAQIGTVNSSGTKLLSVSGDCECPGVYEFAFGITVSDLLKECGGQDAVAVLVGGPSGQFICSSQFNKKICYDDLATGGSIVVFSPDRDILKIVREYMEFFVEESCGYCTPCRVGTVLIKKKLDDIIAGKAQSSDLDQLKSLCDTVKVTSRCGLGQTCSNPVLSTLRNFSTIYEEKMAEDKGGLQLSFDIKEALKDGESIAHRDSVIF